MQVSGALELHIESLAPQLLAKYADPQDAANGWFMAAFTLHPAHVEHEPFGPAHIHAVDHVANPHLHALTLVSR